MYRAEKKNLCYYNDWRPIVADHVNYDCLYVIVYGDEILDIKKTFQCGLCATTFGSTWQVRYMLFLSL